MQIQILPWSVTTFKLPVHHFPVWRWRDLDPPPTEQVPVTYRMMRFEDRIDMQGVPCRAVYDRETDILFICYPEM